jgi:hypothetical protein
MALGDNEIAMDMVQSVQSSSVRLTSYPDPDPVNPPFPRCCEKCGLTRIHTWRELPIGAAGAALSNALLSSCTERCSDASC